MNVGNPLFDFTDQEPLFNVTDGLAADRKGRFFMRLGDNVAMDVTTGRPVFTTAWPASSDDDEDEDDDD